MGSLDSREVALFEDARVRGSAGAATGCDVVLCCARRERGPALTWRCRSHSALSRPAGRTCGQSRGLGKTSGTHAKARNAHSINRPFASVLQAASHLVLPLASAACTTRYDLCGARLDSCQHSASSCVALAHPCDQPSAPLLQQQSGSAVEAIDSDAAELREPTNALHALIIGHRAHHGRDAVAPGGNKAAAHGARESQSKEGRVSGRCGRSFSLLDVLFRFERRRS